MNKKIETIQVDGTEEKVQWEPDLAKLPAHVIQYLDEPMNRERLRIRRVKIIKTLISMAKESGWKVAIKLYDDKSDTYREIYHIA